ncbi:MAG: hypothetical protein WKI04_18805 [Ferruginibacter sp.]
MAAIINDIGSTHQGSPIPASLLSCKLTAPEFHHRKMTLIANLKKQVTRKNEIENGFAFIFTGSDNMLDEIFEFIKTERECCPFFSFNLFISGVKSEACLEITGPNGSKDFILNEIGL